MKFIFLMTIGTAMSTPVLEHKTCRWSYKQNLYDYSIIHPHRTNL